MRHTRLLLASLLLSLPALVFAQAPLQPDLSSLSSVPLHRAPAAVIDKALAQASSKSRPLRVGVTVALPLGLESGLWDEPETGVARWRMQVSSSGALDLALEFSRFDLPPEASLWIYDTAGQLVQGPYSSLDRNSSGGLWTALVPGSTAVIELRVPSASRDAVKLQMSQVEHAFVDVAKADATAPAKSGSCNVDVVCSDGDNWRPEIRSVARVILTSGGNMFLCSGQLLNDTAFDRQPLFLTANHCGIDSATVANSVVVYWNYQTSTCGGTPNGSLSQNQSGSALLAGDVGTDFTLLKLNRTPNSAYNVYYAGWDATTAAPTSGVAIHHPNGDEKRISTFTTAAVAADVCIDGTTTNCTREVQAWQIHWARGTTEEGSSGGGLWSQNHKLVGVLSGGGASCSTQTDPDYFARFAEGFTANAASTGQLKVWLDNASTGATNLVGADSVVAPLVVANDAYSVAENAAATTLTVLANDTSGAGTIRISAVGTPGAGGTAVISSDALSVNYKPAAGFTGTETFTYTATDGSTSKTATVTMTVTASSSGGGGTSGGGGGSFGLLGLLVMGSAALRRSRRG